MVSGDKYHSGSVVNALTVDVEDYFQIHAFSRVIRREDWRWFESRVERNTHRLLDLLDSSAALFRNGHAALAANPFPTRNDAGDKGSLPRSQTNGPARATFFMLGWIAEYFPQLVKEIHARGHEVACHGYSHQVIFGQSRDEFREDVKRAKCLIEDLTGKQVIGYRAPTYSITRKTLWALEILIELDFIYDSSIFPIRHDIYGFPEASRFPFLVTFNGSHKPEFTDLEYGGSGGQSPCLSPVSTGPDRGLIVEFPMATYRLMRLNFPVAGGGYFRLTPYSLTKKLLMKTNRSESMPFIFYIHPWEIDPHIPRIKGISRLSAFRTYVNLSKTEGKLMRLLTDFQFCPISELIV